MSHDDGRNPMRWECSRQGCFNRVKRPKIEWFADCLPGRIAFSDIDAITEVCGNLLILEFKEHKGLSTGQRVLFERVTRMCPATVLIVEADAQSMTVQSISVVSKGVISPPEPADLNDLRNRIQGWTEMALVHSPLRSEPAACR